MPTIRTSINSIASRLGDRMDPVLVKEVRQALSSGLFDTSFILMQAAMGVVLLVSATNPTGSSRGLAIALAVLFCVAFPLRAQISTYNDLEQENLDLVQLTETTGPRLIYSKIVAQLAIMLVFACTLLPWFTARYFTGGIEILSDLYSFAAWLLLGTWITTAACIAAAFRSMLRILTTLAIVSLGGLLCLIADSVAEETVIYRDNTSYQAILGAGSILILILLPMFVQALLVAAARLEQSGERFETRIRLWTLPAILVPSGFPLFLHHDLTFVLVPLGAVAAATFILHASQLPDRVRSARTWIHWPRPLRACARMLLAPTWPSGLFCAASISLLGIAYLWIVLGMNVGYLTDFHKAGLIFAHVTLQLALIATLLTHLTRSRLPLIASLVIVVATDVLSSLLIAFLVDTKVIDFNPCFGILPTCGMLFLESKRIDDIPIYALLQLAWTDLAFMVAIARLAPTPRRREEAEKARLQSPDSAG